MGCGVQLVVVVDGGSPAQAAASQKGSGAHVRSCEEQGDVGTTAGDGADMAVGMVNGGVTDSRCHCEDCSTRSQFS